MDLPKPPEDQDLKNIIDKLAQFVSRNGPEFENMTKNKQKDNPKFSFLFGGDYFNYYQYKVTTEQAILKHKQTREQQQPPTNVPNFPNQQNFYQNPYQYPQSQPQQGFQNDPTKVGIPQNIQFALPAVQPQYPGMAVSNVGYGALYPNQSDQQQYANSFQQSTDAFQILPQALPLQTVAASEGVSQMTGNFVTPQISATPVMPVSIQEIDAKIEKLEVELKTLKEQVVQSEQNLTAQRDVLDQQTEVHVKEGVYVARGEVLKKQAEDLGLTLSAFEEVLSPIMESCTKDAISNGKHWIFSKASSPGINRWISNFLLYKATNTSLSFSHKLHIVYLMNDVLHHCIRKGAEDLRSTLQSVLAPMYCHAVLCASDEGKKKLDKLLSLWESKMHLPDSLLRQLRVPADTLDDIEKVLIAEFPQVAETVQLRMNETFKNYQQQHNAFVEHATSQITKTEQEKLELEQQKIQQQNFMQNAATAAALAANFSQSGQMGAAGEVGFQQPQFNPAESLPAVDFSRPPPGFSNEDEENLIPNIPYFDLPAGLMVPLVKPGDNKYQALDPSKLRLPRPCPPTERLLRAVDNFYNMAPSHERPRNADGWEQLALYEYYKMKAAAIREKENQIAGRTREKSRSPTPIVLENEIEQLSKQFKKKAKVRRYESVSPEPEPQSEDPEQKDNIPSLMKIKSAEENQRIENQRYDSQRNENQRYDDQRNENQRYDDQRNENQRYDDQRNENQRYDNQRRGPRNSPPGRSISFGFRRSRSLSPRKSRSSSRSKSRSRSRSSSRSRSRTRSRTRSRSRSRTRSRSRSRSRGRSPMLRVPFRRSPRRSSRSPIPPYRSSDYSTTKDGLQESNKGHQMLKNMGWSGTGLGAKEQGIEEPIQPGEVRDSGAERFKGLGIPSAKSDPFEAYRKTRGQAFISRMKARAIERDSKK